MHEDRFYPAADLAQAIGVRRAFLCLNDLIQLNPDDAQAYLLRGNLHDEIGELGLAILDYNRSISLKPTADGYNKRSAAHSDQMEYQKAAKDAAKAVSLDPNLMLAYVNRALAYAALFRDEEAEMDKRRASELGFDGVYLTEMIEGIQAEVVLPLSLGLPFPYPTSSNGESTSSPTKISGD